MSPEQLEYQKGFYEAHPSIQKLERRFRKAEKVRYVLRQYPAAFDLKRAICVDIGCSSGVITNHISDLFRLVVGLEYDFYALKQHGPLGDNVQLIHGDAMRLPVADQSVDFILCLQVYEHVPDAEILVCEMDRVLKPGGVIFFSGPNKGFPIELHYHLPFLHWLPRKWASALLKILGRGDHFYERIYSRNELMHLFQRFEILDISVDILQQGQQFAGLRGPVLWLTKLPASFLNLFRGIFPNYNWLLYKSS